MTRDRWLSTSVFALLIGLAGPAYAQDLQDRPVDPPPPSPAGPTDEDEIEFGAGELQYDYEADIVTATGDVRLFREGNRLRADRVVWNRGTGQVVATGNIAVTNPQGDIAYGDSIELTDSLKDGVVDNMLLVLDEGDRLAARRGNRSDGIVTLEDAAYTPCAVVDERGCPKEPVWKIEAVRVTYDPDRQRVSYRGARASLFGLTIPLPNFSHPVSDAGGSGLLNPNIGYSEANGLDVSIPYHWRIAPDRDLLVTPRVFSAVAPMISAEYRALTATGAYRVGGSLTYSDVAPALITPDQPGREQLRGYVDAAGRLQLNEAWSIDSSIRVATDRTFLRRYNFSSDDRLRSYVRAERVDRASFLSIAGWANQTLRIGEDQSQPFAVPAIDYRLRLRDPLDAGTIEVQANSLALIRSEGQDTQRAFASGRYDIRQLTAWGQEVTLTGYVRGDVYHTDDTLSTAVLGYRGTEGFSTRGIAIGALDVRWPLIGEFLGGTQRITPRVQLVASPHFANLDIPNEDARAVDLEDSNLFALNRFPGYDRVEDSSRVTYGIDYVLDIPDFSIEATVGQSYRFETARTLFPDGTGLYDRFSDIVGRTRVRFRDFVTLTHRYRVDKDNLAVRRNEVDAVVGSKQTYGVIGYLRLNRNIGPELEDLQDREEARVGGRIALGRFWSVFGSAIVDLTDTEEDPLSAADGYSPIRHRLGVAYEDDCIDIELTWKRDYRTVGDAAQGSSFLLRLALKNLGR